MNAPPSTAHGPRIAPALAFGLLLTLASAAGQTFFIALFAGQWRPEFGLSHGAFGGLYTLATLASAACLYRLGQLADHVSLGRLAAWVLIALAAACVLVATAQGALTLLVALFALRLAGQGMSSHVAMTAMGRWFTHRRGLALSIATLGFPLGEAVFPALVAYALIGFDWRVIWLVTAVAVAGVLLPATGWCAARAMPKSPTGEDASAKRTSATGSTDWSRSRVLRDARFWALLPAILSPPFMVTGTFFHQVHLVEAKGWTLAFFAATFPLFAGAQVVVALVFGWLTDRAGALRLLPVYLLPLLSGLVIFGLGSAPWTAAVAMLLIGATAGAASVVLGALWVELYGPTHLGAIRAVVYAFMVVATAASPGLMGVLLDAGMELQTQFLGMAGYLVICISAVTLGRRWLLRPGVG